MNKKYLTLLIFFASYLWFNSFGRAILPVHFLDQGLSITQQIFSMSLVFVAQIILLLALRGLVAKAAWRISIILVFIFLLLSIKIIHPIQFYLASLISGASFYFYWIFYNIAHFENTPQHSIGKSSALMFSIPPLISVTAPLLAGFLAEINLNFVWVLSSAFFLISIVLVNKQKNFKVIYSIKKSLNEIKATRNLIFLEGIWEAVIFGVIPIYTLFFIKTPGFYGTFLSYLALVGLLANLLLGRLTDKLQKRMVFLYPLTISLGVITCLFPFATFNITAWVIVSGLVQFLLPLFWNISTAIVVDMSTNLRSAIPGRELMLGLGRFLGMLLFFSSLIIEKTPFFIFFILGSAIFLYALVLFWNSKLSKKYKFL